jgi:hypothetical protein
MFISIHRQSFQVFESAALIKGDCPSEGECASVGPCESSAWTRVSVSSTFDAQHIKGNNYYKTKFCGENLKYGEQHVAAA